MARLPLPGPELIDLPAPDLPGEVDRLLDHLWANGHAAYVVGGAIRDQLLGRESADWDVATDALPDRLLELFPNGAYENRFGTVLTDGIEVTTFRRDHRYRDHRRPDEVTFTDSLEEDLSRRDFTINAIAWGRAGGAGGAPGAAGPAPAHWVDPTDGMADVRARRIRAVGDPGARFEEDALRLVRAARIAAQLGFTIEPRTREQMAAHATDVRFLALERIGRELDRLIRARPPSVGFRVLADTGLLEPLFPELAGQRGVPQDKVPGHDLWDHCLATLDAAAGIAPDDETLILAALLHDTGKPETFADGRFLGHDEAGARIASAFLARFAYPGRLTARVARLIQWHMFRYEPAWSDAAVRRFMRRVGVDLVDDLLRLRAADNVGSGWLPDAGGLDELRARIEAQRASGAPLSLRELAIDGHDLQQELGREPGPWIGPLLDRLLESVIADPARNTRETLLVDARDWAGGSGRAGSMADDEAVIGS